MFDGEAGIIGAWRAGIKPEPLLTVSQWADAHRVLSSKGSAEPGQWRNARTPYLAEIMDCLSPSHPAQRVVFMKGAQVGGTECGNNWIGYNIYIGTATALIGWCRRWRRCCPSIACWRSVPAARARWRRCWPS